MKWQFFALGMATLFLMANQECDPSGERPKWRAKFWAGDGSRESIRRVQDNEEIFCSDPRFDDYICVTYDDLEALEERVLSRCERWKP